MGLSKRTSDHGSVQAAMPWDRNHRCARGFRRHHIDAGALVQPAGGNDIDAAESFKFFGRNERIPGHCVLPDALLDLSGPEDMTKGHGRMAEVSKQSSEFRGQKTEVRGEIFYAYSVL